MRSCVCFHSCLFRSASPQHCLGKSVFPDWLMSDICPSAHEDDDAPPLWSVADWTWAETKPFKLVLKQEYSQEYSSKETISKTMFWKVSRQWIFITDNLNLWHGQALCARCHVRAFKGLQQSGDESWIYSYKHQTASFIVEDTEPEEDVSGQESSWDLSCSFRIQKNVFKDLFTLCMEWLIGRWGSVLEHLECSGGVCRASGWGGVTGGWARE